jgi:carbamate kinase
MLTVVALGGNALLRPGENTEMQKLSPEEVRTLVLESSTFMPKKHL